MFLLNGDFKIITKNNKYPSVLYFSFGHYYKIKYLLFSDRISLINLSSDYSCQDFISLTNIRTGYEESQEEKVRIECIIL